MGSIISGGSAHGRTHDHSNPSDGTRLLPDGMLPGGNLIANGSFESGLTGWGLSAGPPYLAGGVLGNVSDGKYCVGFHPALGYQYVTKAIVLAPLLAGHWYCVAYSTLIEAGSVSATGTGVVMEGTDAVAGTINSDLGPIGGTVPLRLSSGAVTQLTWQRRWLSWQQNTSQTDRYILLSDGYGGGHTGGELYIDAVSLTEGASPPNYGGEAATGIPSGVIVMWSGETTAIPIGWLLCDGTLGTPDLRDRFIIGADATNENTSGGTVSASAALATHAGHANHAVTQPGGHNNHAVGQPTAHGGLTSGGPSVTIQVPVTSPTTPVGSTTHTHTLALTNNHSGATVDAHSAHAGTAVDAHSAHDVHAIEKYYRLAFIMKA